MNLTLVPRTANETEFLAIFNRLCVALRETQDDSGITQQVYWEALRDLPMLSIDQSAVALSRQTGRRFFPTTAEWRTEAENASAAHMRKVVPAARVDPWHHECRDCEDSGWVRGLTCDGGTTCGRTRKHMPHDYTMACPCRATNRTYLRHHMYGSGAA